MDEPTGGYRPSDANDSNALAWIAITVGVVAVGVLVFALLASTTAPNTSSIAQADRSSDVALGTKPTQLPKPSDNRTKGSHSAYQQIAPTKPVDDGGILSADSISLQVDKPAAANVDEWAQFRDVSANEPVLQIGKGPATAVHDRRRNDPFSSEVVPKQTIADQRSSSTNDAVPQELSPTQVEEMERAYKQAIDLANHRKQALGDYRRAIQDANDVYDRALSMQMDQLHDIMGGGGRAKGVITACRKALSAVDKAIQQGRNPLVAYDESSRRLQGSQD